MNTLRKENLNFNNNRIETAKSESELWKVANDVIKPRNNDTIKVSTSFNTCISNAIRLWNKAPLELKKCETLPQLKKAAKIFAKTVPI